MDDLDRLYHRLVLNVRDGAPHLLDRQFRLGDVAAHLVPYRHTRRELGFESIQQYEQALLRLLAGERGYLRAEGAVQEAVRRTLGEPQPDGGLLRTHADAPVALPPDALVRARVGAPEGARGADGAPSGTTPAIEPTVSSSSPTPPARPTPSAAASPIAADLERAFVASSQAADAWTDPARAAVGRPTPLRPTPALTPSAPTPGAAADPRAPMANPTPHHPPAAHAGGTCRYCGHPLPEGRRITFCPYCGSNVTVLQCPACSTELEVGWKFCITCGRAMDAGAFADGGAAGGGADGAAAGGAPER